MCIHQSSASWWQKAFQILFLRFNLFFCQFSVTNITYCKHNIVKDSHKKNNHELGFEHNDHTSMFILECDISSSSSLSVLLWSQGRYAAECLAFSLYISGLKVGDIFIYTQRVLVIPHWAKLQPIFSGINDHIRRRYVAADSIGRSLQPGHWLQTRNPSTQWCRVINALAACIAMEPSLRHCQVVFDHRSLAFNPAECRATSITRKAWRWNRCSRRWLDHAAANARLHGTSSTRKGTWTVIITSKDSLLKT